MTSVRTTISVIQLIAYVPQVSSPLRISGTVVGSKEIPISLAVMIPLAKALSVTVGIGVLVAGLKVPKKKIRKWLNFTEEKIHRW